MIINQKSKKKRIAQLVKIKKLKMKVKEVTEKLSEAIQNWQCWTMKCLLYKNNRKVCTS